MRETREMPHVEGVRHQFLDLNGTRIHVAEAGPENAEPVLLLHGWPQHWFMWRNVIGALQADYRLIVPDLRGFGWSAAPGHGYDAETFAADQVALLDALEIERTHLIGHDWGGWTAFLLGLSHPQRLRRILVCNAPHPWPRMRPRLVAEGWRSFYAILNAMPGLGAFLHRRTNFVRMALRWGTAADPFSKAELDEYADSFRDPARALATTKLYRYYLKVFRQATMGHWRGQRLTVPTWIVFGDRDPAITKHLLEGFEAHADDGRLEFVPGASHFIVDERPQLIVERARELFAQTGLSRA